MRTPYATARRLYLKLWLWWNDVCPKHGPMQGGRLNSFCTFCAAKRRADRVTKTDRIMEEYAKS